MSKSRNPYRKCRKRIFVDRQVQGALAKRIIQHWFTFVLFAWISLWTFEAIMVGPGASWYEPLIAVWDKYRMVWLLMFAIIPSFVYDTIKLSSRFAGPMYRFRRYLQALAHGQNPGELRFRDGDFWHTIAEDFNRLTARISSLEAELAQHKSHDWVENPGEGDEPGGHSDRVAPAHATASSS